MTKNDIRACALNNIQWHSHSLECLMANIRYQNVIQCHSASETSACHSLSFNAITKKANG